MKSTLLNQYTLILAAVENTEERLVHPLYGLLTWVIMLGGAFFLILGIANIVTKVTEKEMEELREKNPNISRDTMRFEKIKKGIIQTVIGVIMLVIQNFM